MFSLYLSNDTMTIFLGNLALLQAWRAIERPVPGQWVLLGLIIVIGLLTKLSFLAFIPVLCGLVFWMSGRGRRGLVAATAFGALVLILVRSYKLVENYINFRSPDDHRYRPALPSQLRHRAPHPLQGPRSPT